MERRRLSHWMRQGQGAGEHSMAYENRPINCDNYSWYSRTLNKPHHEIENDFRVWDELASMIDSDLPHTPSIAQAPSPRVALFQIS